LEEKLINEIAAKLLFIMPNLGNRLIKPTEHHVKGLVSPLLLYAIVVLNNRKECTMTQLAKEMCISNSQLTPIINKAVRQNWISRESDEVDRRILNVRITLAGQQMLERLGEEMAARISEKVSLLGDDDILALYRTLNDLNEVLHKLP